MQNCEEKDTFDVAIDGPFVGAVKGAPEGTFESAPEATFSNLHKDI